MHDVIVLGTNPTNLTGCAHIVEQETSMRKIATLSLAALLSVSGSSLALAHGGGGGWPSNPVLTKIYQSQYAAACKADTRHCVGFGKHYYGQ